MDWISPTVTRPAAGTLCLLRGRHPVTDGPALAVAVYAHGLWWPVRLIHHWMDEIEPDTRGPYREDAIEAWHPILDPTQENWHGQIY